MNEHAVAAGQPTSLPAQRLERLRATMREHDVPWLLTADPINIAYATGLRNMTVFSMMGASRFVLVAADGPVVAWEYAGAEHLAEAMPTIDEVRTAAGVTALSGPRYQQDVRTLISDVAEICGASVGSPIRLGVERMDHIVTDALRSAGFELTSATEVFVESRRIKLSAEIAVMTEAMKRVEAGIEIMLEELRPGVSEVAVWSAFHQHLIASDGEYISTRLVQTGERTFPYFQEAGPTLIESGDLFCIDTDAIGFGGYAVDFSRTYQVGPDPPTKAQRHLHALALEQLRHNASLLLPGLSFAEFAAKAWTVPDRHVPYGYSSLAHGLGMSGEYPYIPVADAASDYPLDGVFDPNMVMCVESYIGDPSLGQGVKLEDQYLITDSGAEVMSTLPISARLVSNASD